MKFKLSLVIAFLFIGITACQESKVEKSDLKTQKDSVSYAIGLNIGNSLKRDDIEVNSKTLLQGILDGADRDSMYLITEDDIQKLMMALQQEMSNKQNEKMKNQSETNKKEGEEFLTENAKKEGVKTLPSGLQYKVLSSGNGASPKAEDKVKTHYVGTLLDGTEFDNSYKRGEPAEFPVNQVIKGWTEALQLMKIGDKWQLFIPSDLGYGDQGAGGGQIPPGAVLVFEVELLEIVK